MLWILLQEVDDAMTSPCVVLTVVIERCSGRVKVSQHSELASRHVMRFVVESTMMKSSRQGFAEKCQYVCEMVAQF